MGNRVHIEPTEFKNTATGDVSYGVRVFDDHAQTYDNSWSEIPKDDFAILAKVVESSDDVIVSMISWLIEMGHGIYIGGNYYPYEEIKGVISKDLAGE